MYQYSFSCQVRDASKIVALDMNGPHEPVILKYRQQILII